MVQCNFVSVNNALIWFAVLKADGLGFHLNCSYHEVSLGVGQNRIESNRIEAFIVIILQ